MPGSAGTLETIARQVGLALQPLETQLTSDNIIPFLANLGLQFPPSLTAQAGFMNAANQAATAAGALDALLTQLATDITSDNEDAIVQDGLKVIQQIAIIIPAIEQMGTELTAIASSLGLTPADVLAFAATLAENLLGYLLISYLESIEPGVVGIANLIGLVDYIPNPGTPGDAAHPPYITKELQLSRIHDLFNSPASLLQTLYGWGTPGFDGVAFIARLKTSLDLLGLYSKVTTLTPANSLTSGMFTVAANPGTSPPGLIVSMTYALPEAFNFTLPISTLWSVQATVQGTFAAGLAATITPPAGFSLLPPTGTLTGQLQMNLIAQGADADHPIIILGATGSSRLQANTFQLRSGSHRHLEYDHRDGRRVDSNSGDGRQGRHRYVAIRWIPGGCHWRHADRGRIRHNGHMATGHGNSRDGWRAT